MSFYGIIECFKIAKGAYGTWEVQESLHIITYKFLLLPKSVFDKSYRVFIACAG